MSGTFIHETATLSPEAKVGEGAQVWINVQIREKSTIGKNTTLSKDVYIDHAVSIVTVAAVLLVGVTGLGGVLVKAMIMLICIALPILAGGLTQDEISFIAKKFRTVTAY